MDQLFVDYRGVIVGATGACMILWALIKIARRNATRDQVTRDIIKAAGDDSKDPSQAIDDIAKLLR